jgi:hypothetical protein
MTNTDSTNLVLDRYFRNRSDLGMIYLKFQLVWNWLSNNFYLRIVKKNNVLQIIFFDNMNFI